MDTTASRQRRELSTPASVQTQPELLRAYSPGERPYAMQRASIRTSGLWAIGRGPRSHALFVLADDQCASRTNSFIEANLAQQTLEVRDAGSRNGTFVNGVLLGADERRPLCDGDLLRVGDSFFIFRNQPAIADDGRVVELAGISRGVSQLRAAVTRLAQDAASVLVLGETGTGKELVATALHRLSGRPGRRVAVNCAAIPESLAESLFFGHTRGAFTGASAQSGYFAAAHGGTLFLDEIGDLPLALQAKLLRVLEERMVVPVGSTQPLPCDLRVVAATNRDLEAAIRAGGFREDLFARLTDIVLELPPLRARKEDILLLLEHASGGSLQTLPPDFIELLLLYDWPRNVREVFKVANHLRLFGPDPALQARLKRKVAAPARSIPSSERMAPERTGGRGLERPPRTRKLAPPRKEHLELLMAHHQGVIQDVANELGCSRRQVSRWLDHHEIDRLRFRND